MRELAYLVRILFAVVALRSRDRVLINYACLFLTGSAVSLLLRLTPASADLQLVVVDLAILLYPIGLVYLALQDGRRTALFALPAAALTLAAALAFVELPAAARTPDHWRHLVSSAVHWSADLTVVIILAIKAWRRFRRLVATREPEETPLGEDVAAILVAVDIAGLPLASVIFAQSGWSHRLAMEVVSYGLCSLFVLLAPWAQAGARRVALRLLETD